MPDASTAIVQDGTSRFFAVRENPDTPQAYVGHQVKRTAAGFVPVAKAREMLVRKIGTVVVKVSL